jgi:hypothetical protein
LYTSVDDLCRGVADVHRRHGSYCNSSHVTSFRVVVYVVCCCALYIVQRHVTPFRVAPERIHKSHFRSLYKLM